MDIPKIKKEISLFLNSEEAKVLKKDIAKLGLAASVIAGIMAQAQNSQAAEDHSDSSTTHTDNTGPHSSHTDHSSSSPHDSGSVHSNCHSDADGAHSSKAAYNDAENKGGHNSKLVHANHCDNA